MFCTNCGKAVSEGRKFCGACGAPVLMVNPAAKPVQAAPNGRPTPKQPIPGGMPPRMTPPPAPQAAPQRVTPPPAPQAAPQRVTPPPAPQAAPQRVTPPPAPQAAPQRVTPPPAPQAVSKATPNPAPQAVPVSQVAPAPVVAPTPEPQNYEAYSGSAPEQMGVGVGVGKGEYLSQYAPNAVKVASIINRAVGVLCILLCVLLCFNALTVSFKDLPIFGFAGVDSIGINTSELADVASAPNADAALKDVTDKVVKTPSVLNVYLFSDSVAQVGEQIGVDMDSVKAAADLCLVMIAIFIFGALLIILLTVLGLLFRNNVLNLAAMLFGAVFALLFDGWLYLLVTVVLYIAFIALQFLVNSKYKEFTYSA